MKKPKLIYIEWYDAISNSDGWKDKNEALDWGKSTNWLVKESGFLIDENDKYILLANKICPPSNKDEDILYGILKKIPKPWIRNKIYLTPYL